MSRKSRLKDRVDGYSPAEATRNDPWKDPNLQKQMESRSDAVFNVDGFKNELTGIGDFMRDKTMGGRIGGPDFIVNLLRGVDCENRWRGSDLGGRVVETIPDEMTREGWDITIQPSNDEPDEDKADAFGQMPPQMDPSIPPEPTPKPGPLPEVDDGSTEQIEEIECALDDLGASDEFWQALSYERAYGGSAILVGADDGQDLWTPLDEDRIKSVNYLNTFSGGWDGEIVAWSYYTDPASPKYGRPEVYMLRNIGVPVVRVPAPGQSVPVASVPSNQLSGSTLLWVHETRLLVFPGIPVSRNARVQMRGWGDSIFVRINEVLSQYNQTWGGVANLMTDFSQGVLSVKDLISSMGANNKAGKPTLTQRAAAINLTRSLSRILMVDADGEDFKRDTASLAGVSDVLQQFALRLAAAADMPVALLMGQAPAGLNATGASDIRFFYDRVAARQRKRLLPQLRRLIHLLMVAKEGPTDGVEPDRWRVTFKPLYQMTALEKADLRLKGAQADDYDIKNQVLSPEEVAASAYGGSDYSTDRVIDFEGRKAMAEQDAADKEERAKAMIEAANKPPPAPEPDPNEPVVTVKAE